jgi:xanthine/uracil permease
MAKWIFLAILVSATAYVLVKGSREAKAALAILLAAYVGTVFIMVAFEDGTANWSDPQPWIAVLDATAFVLLVRIALRSDRFWPMPVAALQVIPALTPIIVAVGEDLARQAIGITQGLWSYLQLAILIGATWRHNRRRSGAL